jgi:copper homeostasis protein
MQTIVEICCSSVDDALAAERGGAHRIEFCSALTLGGLTPSLGALVEAKSRVNISVLPMLRPRAAGFCYSEQEFETMLRDAELFVRHGAEGLVFGILNTDGTVDTTRCARLIAAANGEPCIFHRAFDVTPDPFRAMEQLIELGFARILTSGQQPTAIEGATLIRDLIDRAEGRIEILPGAGIRPANVVKLIRATGCTQIHLSARLTRSDNSTSARPQIKFSNTTGDERQYGCTDETIVHAAVEAVQSVSAI